MKIVRYCIAIVVAIIVLSSLILAGEQHKPEGQCVIVDNREKMNEKISTIVQETDKPLDLLREISYRTNGDIVIFSSLENENWIEYENPNFEGRIIIVSNKINSGEIDALRKMFPKSEAIIVKRS